MAVLRSVGARPRHVLALIVGEATALAAAGLVLGVALLYLGLFVARVLIQSRLGLSIEIGFPSRMSGCCSASCSPASSPVCGRRSGRIVTRSATA